MRPSRVAGTSRNATPLPISAEAEAALIASVLNAFPNVRGMLVDRPEFIDKAASRFEKEGLATRCQVIGADLRKGVPAGADVYMLKHVLHGYDDEAAIEILGHCRSVLPAQGRLLVIEFVLPDMVDHADRELEHRLGSDLNMLAVTGGKERSAIEWKNLLSDSAFECQRIIPVPGEIGFDHRGNPAGLSRGDRTPVELFLRFCSEIDFFWLGSDICRVVDVLVPYVGGGVAGVIEGSSSPRFSRKVADGAKNRLPVTARLKSKSRS